MEIRVAKSAGFCFGVSRAVSLAEEKAATGRVYTFGPIIHNEFEIQRLSSMGVIPVNDVNEIKKGDRVIIRSHGVPEKTEKELAARGAEVFDATCPFVKKYTILFPSIRKKDIPSLYSEMRVIPKLRVLPEGAAARR